MKFPFNASLRTTCRYAKRSIDLNVLLVPMQEGPLSLAGVIHIARWILIDKLSSHFEMVHITMEALRSDSVRGGGKL